MSKIKKITLFSIITIIIFISYSFIEPYWIQVVKYDEVNPNIPKDFNNTKIVFLTDIHHNRFFTTDRVKDLVDKVNSLKPDIILLGGDYIDSGENDIKPCIDELSKLKATIGTYAVLGNHDNWENRNLILDNFQNTNINLIENESFWINKNNSKIKIGGVGDIWSLYQDIDKTTNDLKDEDYAILVSHNPDYVDELKDKKIDLVLSGHSHGGQVTFFGAKIPFVVNVCKDEYRKGIINTKNAKLIVSNGIGTYKYPVRFFARPQIYEITLKSK